MSESAALEQREIHPANAAHDPVAAGVRRRRRVFYVGAIGTLAAAVLGYAVSTVFATDTVEAAAVVAAVKSAQLDFPSTGPVSAIYASVGVPVTQGEVLALRNLSDPLADLSADQAKLASDGFNLHVLLGADVPNPSAALKAQLAADQNALAVAEQTATRTEQADSATVAQSQHELTVLQERRTSHGGTLAGGTDPVGSARATLDLAEATQQADSATDQATIAQANAQLGTIEAEEAVGLPTTQPSALSAAIASIAADQASIVGDAGAVDQSVLRAPFSGVVTSVGGTAGDIDTSQGVKQNTASSPVSQSPSSSLQIFPAAPQQQLPQSTDFAALVTLQSQQTKVVAQVSETNIGRVHVGQSASVSFPAIPGRRYVAVVYKLDPMAVQQNGAAYFLVDLELAGHADRAAFNEPGGRGLVGLTADVTF